jgi:hypothetical protein
MTPKALLRGIGQIFTVFGAFALVFGVIFLVPDLEPWLAAVIGFCVLVFAGRKSGRSEASDELGQKLLRSRLTSCACGSTLKTVTFPDICLRCEGSDVKS